MDYKKIAEAVKLCGSSPATFQCLGGCPYYVHDTNKCIPRMTDDASNAIKELLARTEKAERERDELFRLLCDVCKGVREKRGDDSVCGLCEYDGAHIGESGDWVAECPGFEKDDCFHMKKSLCKKYGQKEK